MMEDDLQSGPGAPDDHATSAADAYSALPLAEGYLRLEDVILDECFPEVDLALRRGRHIHKGDERWFRFLSEAQGLLEPFYRRFGCELEQRADGYFFLLPVSDGLSKRHLGVPEMIVGQGLALCYLDPQSVQSGGVVTREEVLNQLAAVMGTDALMHTLNPKRKRVDERVMQRTVRQKVNEALRRLSLLGFVELVDAEQLRLAPSLMRFAEPVRGLDAPSEALKRLIERGEVSLGPGDAEPRDADADEELDESDETSDEGTHEDASVDGDGQSNAEPARNAGAPAHAEAAPRAAAMLEGTATYEGFPANDAVIGSTESDAEADGGGAGDWANIEGDQAPATPDGEASNEDAQVAGADPNANDDKAPEHVEIDFDWDTLPDEEA